jgi:hypothetical protein
MSFAAIFDSGSSESLAQSAFHRRNLTSAFLGAGRKSPTAVAVSTGRGARLAVLLRRAAIRTNPTPCITAHAACQRTRSVDDEH